MYLDLKILLMSKGYVVTRLLGRDKPYRLTGYAISRVAEFEALPQGIVW